MSKFRFFVIDHSHGFWTIFFAKFPEILRTGSLEIGKFLQVRMRFEGSFDNMEKSKNCYVRYIVTFSSIPFLQKTKATNTLRSITKKKRWIASARACAKTVFSHLNWISLYREHLSIRHHLVKVSGYVLPWFARRTMWRRWCLTFTTLAFSI